MGASVIWKRFPDMRDGFISETARRFRRNRERIARQWIQAIQKHHPPREAAPPPPRPVLDTIPTLIEGIAWHLEHPGGRLSVETPAVRTAIELGRVRHAQGYGAEDILNEYGLLAPVLFDELCDLADHADPPLRPSTVIKAAMLLFSAISAIERATTSHVLALVRARVIEREDRLSAFNRAVSHEIKNQIATIISAGQLLEANGPMSAEQQHRFAGMVTRNAEDIAATLENLLMLARIEDASPQYRQAPIADVVQRVFEQCRGSAEEGSVKLEIEGKLPDVNVPDGAWYVALLNYVRNAIKYRNPTGESPYVKISGAIERNENGAEELVLRVADNGLGVPEEKRGKLFTRFFRAHAGTHPGTGLGLAIVREMIQALGGRAWAEFPGTGSVFYLAVPFHASA
jgi:signal transduction histidine kinase